MSTIIETIAQHLSVWDELYARRWQAYMYSIRRPGESDLERVCRFWALELSSISTDPVREIRIHLTPVNSEDVIVQIVSHDVIPVLRYHANLFTELSRAWGNIY